MRGYRTSAGTEIRLDYGLELAVGLQLFPETAPLAPDLEALNTELDTANNARRAERSPLVKARVALRLANYEADQTIRSCGKAAEIADGGRRGPVFNTLFPDGIVPVVAPAGARQVKPTGQLLDRLTKSKNEAVVAFAKDWQPRLQAALDKLTAAADTHTAALSAYGSKFQDELALRDEHRQSVDRLMGQVRAAFPGDRVKQDLVFPAVEDDPGAGAADNAPADPAAPPEQATPPPAVPA